MKKKEKNENVSREKIVEKESLPFNKGWSGRAPKKNVKKKIKEENSITTVTARSPGEIPETMIWW